MSDQEVVVQFKAVVADFLDKLGSAHKGTADAAEKITSSVKGIGAGFEKLMGTLGALSAVLAGGACFKEAMSATVDWTMEVNKLSKVLGTNLEEASAWAVGLHALGIPADSVKGIVAALTSRIAQGGEAFRKAGIDFKDSEGHIKPMASLLPEIADRAKEFTDEGDKNAFLATILGRRWMEFLPILRLTAERLEEAKKEAKAFGLEVDESGVAKARDYQESMRKMELVTLSMKNALGKELMPVLTSVGHFLGEEGPKMAEGFGVAIKVVVQVFYVLKAVIETITIVVTAVFDELITIFTTLGKVMMAVMSGDFKGAVAIGKQGLQEIKAEDEAVVEGIKKSWADLAKNSKELWKPAEKAPAEKKTKGPRFDPDTKENKPESQMASYQEELDAQKDAIMVLSDFKKTMGKKAEADYWTGVLEELDKGDLDYKAVQSKKVAAEKAMYDERRALAKKDSDENRAMDKADLNEELAIAKDGFTTRRTLIQEEVDAGRMSKEESLRQLMQLKAQELAVEKAAINQEMLDESLSGAQVQALRIKRDATERKAMDDIATYKRQLAQKENLLWVQLGQTIQSSLGNALTSIIMKTQTFGQALQGLFKTVTGSIVQMFVQMGIEQAKQFILSKIQGKAAAVSDITAAAGTYAVNAMSSVAAIPVTGWAMAPGVGAEAFATGMGYMGSIASAAKGWDIPAGLNPMTQLHEREMVLPAEHADTIRNMGKGGGGPQIHFNITAMDGKDVHRTLMKHQDKLFAVLKDGHRNRNGNM